jgi:hypothetical protein
MHPFSGAKGVHLKKVHILLRDFRGSATTLLAWASWVSSVITVPSVLMRPGAA